MNLSLLLNIVHFSVRFVLHFYSSRIITTKAVKEQYSAFILIAIKILKGEKTLASGRHLELQDMRALGNIQGGLLLNVKNQNYIQNVSY